MIVRENDELVDAVGALAAEGLERTDWRCLARYLHLNRECGSSSLNSSEQTIIRVMYKGPGAYSNSCNMTECSLGGTRIHREVCHDAGLRYYQTRSFRAPAQASNRGRSVIGASAFFFTAGDTSHLSIPYTTSHGIPSISAKDRIHWRAYR